jgi:hypothetical protein
VAYSLFIMVAVLMMLERVEMQQGMAPAAFPLQSSWVQHQFRGFVFLRRLLRERLKEEAIYILVFRLSPSV